MGNKKVLFKNKIYHILHSKLFFGVGICILLFFIVTLLNDTMQRRSIDIEIDTMIAAADALENHNVYLGQRIDYLKSDDYIEIEAKKVLGLHKEGESVIIIPDSEIQHLRLASSQIDDVQEAEEVLNVQEEEGAVSLPNYKKWFNYFFNNS